MTSNAPRIDLFSHWTTYFQARLNPNSNELEFEVLPDSEGKPRRRNLFTRPGTGEAKYQELISAFLSLNQESPPEQWEAVASTLGPLVVHDPLDWVALGREIRESSQAWLKARNLLAQLWDDLQTLNATSKELPSDEERHALGVQNLLASGFTPAPEGGIPQQYQHLIEAYTPPPYSERDHLVSRIGEQLNQVFLNGHPPIQPLVEPATLQVEIVVHQGIQALFLMSIALARENAGAFPTRCARPGCIAVTFTEGRKQYCSLRCQQAAKSARQRKRLSEKSTIQEVRSASLE